MKRILILFALTFIITQTMCANISWLETTHNFGTFNEDMGKVSCALRFVNIGTQDVMINEVRPTCGCTAGDYPKRAIAPGDTASITLTYNPSGRPGKFKKDVIVITNTEPRRSVLVIEGIVVGSVSSMNKRYPLAVGALNFNSLILPFGELPKGDTRTSFLYGYNSSMDSIRVNFENIPPFIEVKSIPEIVPPGELATLTLFYNSNKKNDWGTVTDSIIVAATPLNGGKTAKAQIEAIAIIVDNFSKLNEKELKNAPVISLSTPKIDLGIISRSDKNPIKCKFEIENKGKSTLKIRKVSSINKAIAISPMSKEIKKGKKATINVEIDPSLIEGKMLNAKIMIINNDPANSQTPVRIVGELK